MRFVGVILVLVASGAHALDHTAYGLELNKPIALPECVRLKMPAIPNYTPPYAAVTSPCLQPTSVTSGTIAYPIAAGAAHAQDGNLGYRTNQAGALQALVVFTAGASTQQRVLEDLVAKYGPPTTQRMIPLTTASGVTVNSIGATWESDAVRIEFTGIGGRLDSGLLLIGTPTGVQSYHEQLDRVLRRGQRL